MEDSLISDHTQPPYIKKLKEIPPFSVWEIDGAYVRSHICNDFVCSAAHHSFSFIPEHEFWIDKEMAPGETDFFVSFLLKEFNCRAMGMTDDEAFKLATRKEKSERHKSAKYLEVKNLPKAEALKKIYKKKLKSYSNNSFTVWVVDGELVRDLCYSDYTEGGHDSVYNFIPDGEIWLDDDLGQTTERRLVLLHELEERASMISQGMDYASAHKLANETELHCRNYPEDLGKCLKEALVKNAKIHKSNS